MTLPGQRTTHRPAFPPYPEDPTTATRHLCAGAYLDDAFRNVSLREVYYQPRRLVAPSYGFDLVPVLAHCLRARNGAIARDAAIVVTLLFTACLSFTSLLGVVAFMATLQVATATYRLARDTFQRLRGDAPLDVTSLIPRAVLLAIGWIAVLLAGTVVSGAYVNQLMNSFATGGLDSAATTTSATAFGGLALAGLIFAYPVAFSLWRQSELSRLTPGSRVTVPARTPRLDEIARQQRGNTVVYSGFRPFVGSGEVIETWGFAQRLIRPEPTMAETFNGAEPKHSAPVRIPERDREFAEPPFDAADVIAYVREHLATLLPQREAEEQIAGLTVEDRVVLAGTEVSHLVPHTDPDVMAAVIRHPTTPARHYLVCQVFSWGGELITTVYVHIAVQGRSLYLELTTTALPPCSDEFRIVDSVDGSGAVAWLRSVRTGIVDTPRTIWRAPMALLRSLINLTMSSGSPGGNARLARGYDYGARVGVRELGANARMRSLVQFQDLDKYQRLIERRVIASVLDFLDERGVDTTEYRARAAQVMNVTTTNNGATVYGGRPTFNGPVAGRDVTGGVSA